MATEHSLGRFLKTGGADIGDVAGCRNNRSGYWQIKINRKIYPAHRLAIFYKRHC
jgi:hypothetical protein